MWDVAKTVAERFVSGYGSDAQNRALSLADATESSGISECAAFYILVAHLVGRSGGLEASR